MDSGFFETLPRLQEVSRSEAEIAWIIYDLGLRADHSGYRLENTKIVYTKFHDALNTITRPRIGSVEKFIKLLQNKVDKKLESPSGGNTVENWLGE